MFHSPPHHVDFGSSAGSRSSHRRVGARRRGRALATLIGVIAIGAVTTYLIVQSHFSSTPPTTSHDVTQLSNPATTTYGAAASVTTNKPPIESPSDSAAAPKSAIEKKDNPQPLASDATPYTPTPAKTAATKPALPELGSPLKRNDGMSTLSLRPSSEDPHQPRDWTLINGARAVASFVRLDQGIVTLRDPSGQDHEIALPRLSEADRSFIDAITK